MRKRRYLAPWRRKVLDASELRREGEEAAAALAALEGKAAIYYCVPRVVNREFVLKWEVSLNCLFLTCLRGARRRPPRRAGRELTRA